MPKTKKKQDVVEIGFQDVDIRYLPEFTYRGLNGKYGELINSLIEWCAGADGSKMRIFAPPKNSSRQQIVNLRISILKAFKRYNVPAKCGYSSRKGLYFITVNKGGKRGKKQLSKNA